MSLKKADRPIAEVLGYFAKFGLEVGLLVPTKTGLEKSIMDAHAPLRDYLSSKNIHRYDTQGQGGQHKRQLKALLVHHDRLEETVASLYRPETKSGDPRIWFTKLGGYAKAHNVLVVLAENDELFVVNASNLDLLKSGEDSQSPLGRIIARLSPKMSEAAEELIEKLRKIAAQGFVASLRDGPTGIGFTLETLLGIRANANTTPDYKGIEIKSGRVGAGGRANTRMTIFSRVPDWKLSAVRTGLELVSRYGYTDATTGRRQLYCSMKNTPNTLGLFLAVDNDAEILHSRYSEPRREALTSILSGSASVRDLERGTVDQGSAYSRTSDKVFNVVQWGMPKLRSALVEKHPETCVVKALPRIANGKEEFHYFSARYSRGPLLSNLSALLETGIVEVDFALHLVDGKGGKQRARDHGYLFKIWEEHCHLLFPSPRTIDFRT